MEVKQLWNQPIFDVFLGNGWKNWTRIKVQKDKSMIIIKGEQLSKTEKVNVANHILTTFYYEEGKENV